MLKLQESWRILYQVLTHRKFMCQFGTIDFKRLVWQLPLGNLVFNYWRCCSWLTNTAHFIARLSRWWHHPSSYSIQRETPVSVIPVSISQESHPCGCQHFSPESKYFLPPPLLPARCMSPPSLTWTVATARLVVLSLHWPPHGLSSAWQPAWSCWRVRSCLLLVRTLQWLPISLSEKPLYKPVATVACVLRSSFMSLTSFLTPLSRSFCSSHTCLHEYPVPLQLLFLLFVILFLRNPYLLQILA